MKQEIDDDEDDDEEIWVDYTVHIYLNLSATQNNFHKRYTSAEWKRYFLVIN